MSFIDEHCIVFDSEEENKLEHTDIFNQFRDQVDMLLEQVLAEISLPIEDFVQICERSRYKSAVSRQVYQQITAMDDFSTFKKLMVRRNMELELEAVKALKDETADLSTNDAAAENKIKQNEDSDAKESDSKAPAPASEESKVPAPDIRKTEKVEMLAGSFGIPKTSKMVVNKEVLKTPGQRALLDMEIMHKEEKLMQMELEDIIKESLDVEQERIKAVKSEEKATSDGRSSRTEDLINTADFVEKAKIEAVEQVNAEAKEDESSSTPDAKQCSMPNLKPLPQLDSAIKPLSKKAALPQLRSKMGERKRQAQEVFARNQENLQQQKIKEIELAKQAKVTEEEMQQRAVFLKQQREKIKAKREAERVAKLKEAEKKKNTTPTKKQRKPAAEAKHEPSPSRWDAKNDSPAQSKDSGAMDETTEKRNRIRVALAQRMKLELLESEHERLHAIQAQQFADLDSKLRQVEDARMRNQMQEQEMFMRVKQQQDAHFQNVKKSAQSMMNSDF